MFISREGKPATRDSMTKVLTPYGESLVISPERVVGRISVDWKNMHGDYDRFGGAALDKELVKIAAFLRSTFKQFPQTVVTHVSGDTFVVTSGTLKNEQLLNILKDKGASLKSLGHLVCVAGFPDPLTEAVFAYWQKHPENRFNRVEMAGKSVCAVDIRHLRRVTEAKTMEVIEPLLTNFLGQLQMTFLHDQVFRTRSDEFWIFSSKHAPSELDTLMESFAAKYKGSLEFDWGVGSNLNGADQHLTARKRMLEPAKRVQENGVELFTLHLPR